MINALLLAGEATSSSYLDVLSSINRDLRNICVNESADHQRHEDLGLGPK